MPKNDHHKYIFVVGGVMSGVGKGIATASIAKIIQAKGYKVNPIKIDPYLNVDAGTMNPTEHGEVFVLNSGLETDQDMGNYERFLDLDLSPEDYMTSGMVYKAVIDRERALGYGGKCVEPVYYITEEILNRIKKAAHRHGSNVTVVEIGGTIGDYQNVLFMEAARMLKIKHPDDVLFVMVSYLPVPGTLGEMKTRPTQNAVHQLNGYGIQPDFIVARSTLPLDHKRKEKIALMCNIRPEHVISAPDIESVYDVPINFERDKLGEQLLKALKLRPKTKAKHDGLAPWRAFVARTKSSKDELKIAVVGKYFDTGDFVLSDAYLSVIEAAKYSCYEAGVKASLTWINSKKFETGELKIESLADYAGIIVPGGFGTSGIEGVIKAIKFAREKKIPYLGLCYGMQLMVVEYARNVLGLKDATTTEIDPNTKNPIIDIMPDQKKKLTEGNFGASMRLGSYLALLKEGSIAREAYGKELIKERHRHRYEVNPAYVERLSKAGLVFSGISPNGALCEIAELPKTKHPFFVGSQFHPELQARPLHPHPLFSAFVRAAKERTSKKSK